MSRVSRIWRRADGGIAAQVQFANHAHWVEVSKLPGDKPAVISISKAELDSAACQDMCWALDTARNLAQDWDRMGTELALAERRL